MLVYFKNTQGITDEIDVKPEETMKKFVARIRQLGSMEKVRINKYSIRALEIMI